MGTCMSPKDCICIAIKIYYFNDVKVYFLTRKYHFPYKVLPFVYICLVLNIYQNVILHTLAGVKKKKY